MMLKFFCEKKNFLSQKELLELNAFAQLLPGPSSTQTVMLIGYNRGGPLLAILALLIWVLPAGLLMLAFSFLVSYMNLKNVEPRLFHFVHPMTIGFVIYAALKMMKHSVTNLATSVIMVLCALITIIIHSPWVIPILFVLSGFITNLSNKRIPEKTAPRKKLKWINLRLFIIVFIGLGVLSELARINQWAYGRIFNLAENFYRFGTLVYGGGQALMPMMLFQFVSKPTSMGMDPFLSSSELMTGFGMVQALPGPVFSVCAFVGGMSVNHMSESVQIAGGIVSLLAVYLPSTLLLLFFYPVYQNLKQHVIIFRALEGINAMIVGIIWASGILFLMEIFKIDRNSVMNGQWKDYTDLASIVTILATFLCLKYTKIPAPVLVLSALTLGYFWG
jgi:chromate transporter